MKIGYARVSTDEQNLDMQIMALKAAGCGVIYEDVGLSGAARERPGLAQAMTKLHEGDVLVVWKLDRLGRSLGHLVDVLDKLGKRDVGFASITENIDTTTAGGRLVFHMMGAMAEFERSMIGERTRAGMKAAKERGKHIGRPRLLTNKQLTKAAGWIDRGEKRPKEVAALLGVEVDTLRKALQRHRGKD